MGFLFFTCIKPISKFLGIVPLNWSMIIVAMVTAVIGCYNFSESIIYFENIKFLNVNIYMYMILEIIISLLLFLAFFAKKEKYNLIVYLICSVYTFFSLIYSIYKLSIFKPGVGEAKKENFIKLIYLIRVLYEFLIKIIITYIVYSFKKNMD